MLSIGTKKYRNLQEQVAYNTECIKKLDEYLDGITIEDKLVTIANDSGTFTEEELVILSAPLAFISDGSKVWIKQEEDLTKFVYKAIDIVATEVGGVYFNIGGTKITVDRSSGAYNTSTEVIIATYNKSQLDTLLASKADASALTDGLALKADIAGQAFTGPITSPSIIQTMSGFSFEKDDPTHITYSYASVVQNGNKITFVVCGVINRLESADSYFAVCKFRLPATIGAKLIPIQGSAIDNKNMTVFKNNYSIKTLQAVATKQSDARFDVGLYGIGSLDANTDYVFRYEVTFLLSDNLVS